MGTSRFGVLLVDDFAPFRRVVSSMLKERQDVQVIGEASDGLDAVQKAQELQPDLILMDIGLPKLNGIEAARRIRKRSPKSRILFVSQESSAVVVEEALRMGASGYVLKTDAGGELLAAVNTVLRGEIFVSSRFAGHDFTGASVTRAPESVRRTKGSAPVPRQNLETAHRHEVGFYSDDRFLLDHLTQFIGAALKAGNSAIVVAMESHRVSLLSRLQTDGLDVDAAIEQGRYVALDAAEALSAFMANDLPDPVRFLELLGDLIVAATEAAQGEHPRVAVFGECVHLLWARGNAQAAIQMEKLGNQLTQTYDVDILCGYSPGSVPGGMDDHIFHRICAQHSAVYAK